MIWRFGKPFKTLGGKGRQGLSHFLALMGVLAGLGWVGAPLNASAASLADGVWMTANGKSAVEIRSCDDRLCGYAADGSQSQAVAATLDGQSGPQGGEVKTTESKGRLLTNFSGGPLHWSGGVIRDPRNGRVYTGTLQVIDASTLRVTGCLVGPLCASQTWKRIR